MAKFDKMVAKFDTLTDTKEIDTAINSLEDVKAALKEAVSHYGDKEKLHDPREVWYSNALDSYETKLAKVDAVVLSLIAKKISLGAK